MLVTMLTCSENARRRALALSAALAVLLALCAGAVLAGAGADPATAARAQLIGKTKKTPHPDCPFQEKGNRVVRDCQAVGNLTGFQANAGGSKSLFKAPRDGKLVAWSVDLSKPKDSEQKFFEKTYKDKKLGGKPAARIAVLRRSQGKKYKLEGQGPVAELSEHFGTKPIFTLAKPLRLKKGDIIALTIPTYVPNFATGLAGNNSWRASRAGNRCDVSTDTAKGRTNLKKSRPQTDEGSTRVYGCAYRDARLLYWGYYTAG